MDEPLPAPRLGNTYERDHALRGHLRRLIPGPTLDRHGPDLLRLGGLAAGELRALADQAETQPPRLVSYDASGNRIDRIEVSPAWEALHGHSVRLGLCAQPYDEPPEPWRRIVQHALVHLYAPSSAIYSCPVAMTDAAARVLTDHGGHEIRDRVVRRLTSREVSAAWTSGQWMTERSGGSDVSHTATEARQDASGRWRLTGLKWFTSATTADCALVLARPTNAATGSAGLGLFLVERVDPVDGVLQVGRTIKVRRLKDKLGTRALPTAELELEDAVATPVVLEHGLRAISGMLNVTRMHNAWNAAAGMRRAVDLATSYAQQRVAFGRHLADLGLHRQTLAELEVAAQSSLAMTIDLSAVVGRVEADTADDADRLRQRLLTPIAKLVTGKDAVAVASEALESFGGAGYVEDTGLPRLLRNAQVLPIWEGTTNVLSLDVLRVLGREPVALTVALEDLHNRLSQAGGVLSVDTALEQVASACDDLGEAAAKWVSGGLEQAEPMMRAFSMRLGRVWTAAVMWEHAAHMKGTADRDAAGCATIAATAFTRRWFDTGHWHATMPPDEAAALVHPAS